MKRNDDNESRYPYNFPDPFVSESSISIAAACADGIVMIAVHDTNPEPLLYARKFSSREVQDISYLENKEDKKDSMFFQDLPDFSKAPLRIEAVDAYGSAIVTAGWRTDCNTLASKVRELAATHSERYDAQGISMTTRNGISIKSYGKYIAHASAHWLATCAFSQKARGLHCVGLLGVADNNATGKGHLWLIDSTGVYSVRAHAIGFGAREVNNRLLRTDFQLMKHEDAIASLLTILRDEGRIANNCNTRYIETVVIQSSSLKRKRWTTQNPMFTE